MSKQIKEKILKYNVIFQPEPEGGYTVVVPALRGCVTYGRTLDEAKKMGQDAIRCYVGSLVDDGEDVPTDEKSFITTIDLGFSTIKMAHA